MRPSYFCNPEFAGFLIFRRFRTGLYVQFKIEIDIVCKTHCCFDWPRKVVFVQSDLNQPATTFPCFTLFLHPLPIMALQGFFPNNQQNKNQNNNQF